MEFAKTLKTLIRQRGTTTNEVAREINVSPKTINDWLTGRTPRDLDAVKRCAQHLNVSVHYLLYGVDDGNGSLAAILDKTEIFAGIFEITIKKVKSKNE